MPKLNNDVLLLLYAHLKTKAPDDLKELQSLNETYGKMLPPALEAFEQEAEFALTTFIHWGPLIDQLSALLPKTPS